MFGFIKIIIARPRMTKALKQSKHNLDMKRYGKWLQDINLKNSKKSGNLTENYLIWKVGLGILYIGLRIWKDFEASNLVIDKFISINHWNLRIPKPL